MGATRLIVLVAAAATFLSLGCDESKVPKAAVHNSLDQCIVESAWYDDGEDQPYGRAYGWVDAIGKGGKTAEREVVEGSGYAYAVLAPGTDCYATAKLPGGTLWRTKQKQQMKTGQTLVIDFSADSAEPVDTSQPDICRFCRLGCCENSIHADAATPPVEAGDDAEPDVEDAGVDAEEDVVEAGDEPVDDAAAD